MKKVFLCVFVVLGVLTSCQGSVKQQTNSRDSVMSQADSVVVDSSVVVDEKMPPKSVDGLFDDFIYSFMTNRRFQMQRIDFPLPVSDARTGTKSYLQQKQWHYDRLYSTKQAYIVIYGHHNNTNLEKDTKLNRVVVEWINLNKKTVKQYDFQREEGIWKLKALRYEDVRQNANADFLNFYQRFAVDSAFQRRHVSQTVSFKTYDSDNFETVEGVVDVDQWFAFKPDLPHGVIANVNYGQQYRDNRERVMVISGLSNSMHSVLTFKKKNGSWILTKFEN